MDHKRGAELGPRQQQWQLCEPGLFHAKSTAQPLLIASIPMQLLAATAAAAISKQQQQQQQQQQQASLCVSAGCRHFSDRGTYTAKQLLTAGPGEWPVTTRRQGPSPGPYHGSLPRSLPSMRRYPAAAAPAGTVLPATGRFTAPWNCNPAAMSPGSTSQPRSAKPWPARKAGENALLELSLPAAPCCTAWLFRLRTICTGLPDWTNPGSNFHGSP